MEKDLESYRAHNAHYVTRDTPEFTRKLISELYPEGWLETSRIGRAIEKVEDRSLHIDIGSGTGWLIEKTSPLFRQVIAVEPSKSAMETSKAINERAKNITYINKDMVDAIPDLPFEEPFFITTTCVFSHIKDYYVKHFLSALRNAKPGSTLYFDENYDTNIRRKRWYIRNQQWWRNCLPDWQLEFFEMDNEGYVNGIFGTYVGESRVVQVPKYTVAEEIRWYAQGLLNFCIRATNKAFGSNLGLQKFN